MPVTDAQIPTTHTDSSGRPIVRYVVRFRYWPPYGDGTIPHAALLAVPEEQELA